ncbi:MAG: PP2C family protein-serine/threonine phosphatase [Nannocystaceae bacterium]|nr:hypothetical protein [bacterium]
MNRPWSGYVQPLDAFTGPGVCSHNEDHFAAFPIQRLWVLVDAFGGSGSGAFVGPLLVDALLSSWVRTDAPTDVRMRNAIAAANDALVRATRSVHRGSGASLVAVAVDAPDSVVVAHVGSCKAFVLRGCTCNAVTTEHTIAAERPSAGPAYRDVLTRVLGEDAQHAEPTVRRISLAPDDGILLCSAPVHEALDIETMQSILGALGSHASAAEALVTAATERGAMNSTVVVLPRIGKAGAEPSGA